MQKTFTISDLAEEFGVTLRTLRFYEDKHLLSPRREGLSRFYGRRDHSRLKLILLGKRVGLSLSEIKEMLDLYDLRDGNPTRLKAALHLFAAQIELLKRHRTDVDHAISELTRTTAVVADMLRARQARPEAVLEAAE